jgi:hypothetical protein
MLERVIAAGDDTLPYFGMGRRLPGDKKALIRQILEALVRVDALKLRKEKMRFVHKTFQYFEMGPNSSRGMTIQITS